MTDDNSILKKFSSAHDIRKAIYLGTLSCRQLIEAYLSAIEKINPQINAYTQVLNDRARSQAEQLDKKIARGENIGALAGMPFAVKNLFDIKGHTTLAGAKINRSYKPASADALLIQRLENADAILLGALNMGEYAYDFTGENCHYGNCANPWKLEHMSGGSSSGSGAATAAGIAPLSLGSDTNGSIRVPASFCGVFGLKPTYGRLPRTGSFPFCDSLDHLGPLARNVSDLALAFDLMQGFDASDHACANRPALVTSGNLAGDISGLRIKKATGYFNTEDFPQAQAASEKICQALSVSDEVDIPGTLEGRSAAYLLTNIEGSALHKSRLQQRSHDFDPDTRDRFIAGALLPASWYIRAQQIRHWYRRQVLEVFEHCDIIIAPATPCCAPKMGEKELVIRGETQALRPNLGYFTQPISAAGVPSVVVPTVDSDSQLPIGVQIISPPWREDLCLRVAYHLEQLGFSARPSPLL